MARLVALDGDEGRSKIPKAGERRRGQGNKTTGASHDQTAHVRRCYVVDQR